MTIERLIKTCENCHEEFDVLEDIRDDVVICKKCAYLSEKEKNYEEEKLTKFYADWTPIYPQNDLPKSGKRVLITVKYEKTTHVTIGEWVSKFSMEHLDDDFEEREDCYDKASDTYYWPEGWYELTYENEEEVFAITGEVTAWMPLPKPYKDDDR